MSSPADRLRATFTAPDGTGAASYAPEVGPAATVVAGTWQVQSGKLACVTPAVGVNNQVKWSPGGTGRQFLTLLFTTPAGVGLNYIEFNYLDDDNYWQLQFSGSHLILVEVTAGVTTVRHDIDAGLASNTTYRVRVFADRDAVTCDATVAGVLKQVAWAAAGRPNQTATGVIVGFYEPGGGAGAWDDMRLTHQDTFLNVHVDTALGADAWQGNYSRASLAALAFTSGDGSAWDGPAFATPAQAALYARPTGTVWFRGGQTSAAAGLAFTSNTLQPFGSGHVTIDGTGQYPAGAAGPVLTLGGVDGGILGTYDQRFRVRGTHSDGDTTDPNSDTDVNLASYCSGVLTLRNVELYEFGHAGLKFYVQPALGSAVECCVARDGGFTARDHGAYDPKGDTEYAGVIFHHITGYGLHGYSGADPNGPLGPVKARACAAYQCGQVAGAGGMLIHGDAGHALLHCTVADCAGAGGIELWGDANGARVEDCFVQTPGCTNDIHVNAAGTVSLSAGHNRKSSVGGNGAAAYTSTTDVTTADLLDGTPAVPTDLRRTGGLRDGADLGSDSRERLDPTSDWPRLVYDAGLPSVGAYALAGAAGGGAPLARVFGGF